MLALRSRPDALPVAPPDMAASGVIFPLSGWREQA